VEASTNVYILFGQHTCIIYADKDNKTLSNTLNRVVSTLSKKIRKMFLFMPWMSINIDFYKAPPFPPPHPHPFPIKTKLELKKIDHMHVNGNALLV
jgi:hypothetical protein